MSAFDTVFEVAAALTLGRVLNATAANLGGNWGVVRCADALGAFDARSEAWCGKGDDRSFPSREDAELWARRMSGSSWDAAAYEALEIPVVPALAITVGPIHCAIGPVAFGCIDWSSGPGVAIETGDESAFGAACAFIDRVGHQRALAALEGP